MFLRPFSRRVLSPFSRYHFVSSDLAPSRLLHFRPTYTKAEAKQPSVDVEQSINVVVEQVEKLFHHLKLTDNTKDNNNNNNNNNKEHQQVTVTAHKGENIVIPADDGTIEVKSAAGSDVTRVIWDKIKQKLVLPHLDIDIKKFYDIAIPFLHKEKTQESREDDFYQQMLDRDTIHDLVYFMNSDSIEIKLDAVKTLCMLSINENLREDIFWTAGTRLMELCKDEDEKIQTYSLTTIGNIVLKDSVRKELLEKYNYDVFVQLADSETVDIHVKKKSRRVLAILGINDYFLPWDKTTRGVRILTIDGGGTRGVATIEMLKKFEEVTGKKLHELFDLVGGTSTGAQITAAMAVRRLPISEIERSYIEHCNSIFTASASTATAAATAAADATSTAYSLSTALSSQWAKLSLGAYYKAKTLEDLLMQLFEDRVLIDTSEDYNVKFFALSTLVNSLPSQPYIFRNYQYPPNSSNSRYPGSCTAHVWQALRASTAAPSYFDEFTLGSERLQDGGIVANNPTAIAYHEAKKIWGPDVKIDCVVSLGTGKGYPKPTKNSLKDTLVTLVDSATSSDRVHEIMEDVIPEGRYFRFNPTHEAFSVDLDETRPEKLEAMQVAARNFTTEKDEIFREACKFLVGEQ